MSSLKQLFFYLVLLEVILFMLSCKNRNLSEAKEIIQEWVGKTIIFPDSSLCVSLNKKIDCILPESTPYKILVYIDSTGCTDCKLQLYKWATYISELEKEMSGSVNFQFYIHPKNEEELFMVLKRYNFEYPVHVDKDNNLNKLNKFCSNNKYHTFLLDKDNRVVLIGNPIHSDKVWQLYRQAINTGKLQRVSREVITRITSIEVKETTQIIENMRAHESSIAVFTIKNTGNNFLSIKDIQTSCGCTVPTWVKKPIPPGDSTEIKVQITPEYEGYFQKKIVVISNIKDRRTIFIVKGKVKKGDNGKVG